MAGDRITKLERMLNLTALLLETRRPLTIDQIGAKMHGYPDDPASFRRQFERDKDELRAAGVPIEVAPISAADQSEFGYRIPADRFYLPDPGLDPDESAALQFALGSISIDGAAADDVLVKLGLSTAPQQPAMANVDASPAVATLREAIAERRVVSFGYRGVSRDVEPHRLDYQRGRWYLTAHDRGRDDLRCFRVDRFDGTVTAGEPDQYERPESTGAIHLEPWRFGDDPPVTAVVRVDEGFVGLVTEEFGADADWRADDDGSAVVRCEVSGRAAFFTVLIRLLDHVELLEPAELRSDFVELLEGLQR